MIDTNKYEGHYEGPWKHMYQAWGGVDYIMSPHEGCVAKIDNGDKSSVENRANAQLIADVPLLLAEVKELRRQIKVAQGVFEHLYDDELEDASWIRWFCNMEDEEE